MAALQTTFISLEHLWVHNSGRAQLDCSPIHVASAKAVELEGLFPRWLLYYLSGILVLPSLSLTFSLPIMSHPPDLSTWLGLLTSTVVTGDRRWKPQGQLRTSLELTQLHLHPVLLAKGVPAFAQIYKGGAIDRTFWNKDKDKLQKSMQGARDCCGHLQKIKSATVTTHSLSLGSLSPSVLSLDSFIHSTNNSWVGLVTLAEDWIQNFLENEKGLETISVF